MAGYRHPVSTSARRPAARPRSARATVLKLECSRDWTEEFDPCSYSRTDALKVGPWISKLIAFYQRVRLADETARIDQEAEDTLKRASGVDFGEER
jgi:hypothetical protein